MVDRESVLAEIRFFSRLANAVMLLGFLFLALGIISDSGILDSLKITLGLEPMSWFLMAIFCMVGSISPKLHVVAGKHLLGIETENKKE
jgi:hypothetical protein